uniref:(northern house mosquito) hypothetical protein n=1 Tax=Culex pipiens TaxID=7175 RepID=A0A8D8J5I8_CULPI
MRRLTFLKLHFLPSVNGIVQKRNFRLQTLPLEHPRPLQQLQTTVANVRSQSVPGNNHHIRKILQHVANRHFLAHSGTIERKQLIALFCVTDSAPQEFILLPRLAPKIALLAR